MKQLQGSGVTIMAAFVAHLFMYDLLSSSSIPPNATENTYLYFRHYQANRPLWPILEKRRDELRTRARPRERIEFFGWYMALPIPISHAENRAHHPLRLLATEPWQWGTNSLGCDAQKKKECTKKDGRVEGIGQGV
jgi:hypothetical protein